MNAFKSSGYRFGWAVAALAMVLASSAYSLASEEDGGWSSSGGDPLRFHFEEGMDLAKDIAGRMEMTQIATTAESATRAWLQKNLDQLEADLGATAVEWLEDSSSTATQATCAITQRVRGAKVVVSFDKCRGQITSETEAAKVLIHEAVHHFGVEDEHLANDVALEIFKAWEKLKLNEVPACNSKRNLYARNLGGMWNMDRPMSRRMGSPWVKTNADTGSVRFVINPEMLKQFKGFGRCAYTAGTMTIRNREGVLRTPFALIEFRGNPAIVTFERENDSSKTRPRFTMISKAKDSDDDLLFMGDRFHNVGLTVFCRHGADGCTTTGNGGGGGNGAHGGGNKD